jgi:hypothetical protein
MTVVDVCRAGEDVRNYGESSNRDRIVKTVASRDWEGAKEYM